MLTPFSRYGVTLSKCCSAIALYPLKGRYSTLFACRRRKRTLSSKVCCPTSSYLSRRDLIAGIFQLQYRQSCYFVQPKQHSDTREIWYNPLNARDEQQIVQLNAWRSGRTKHKKKAFVPTCGGHPSGVLSRQKTRWTPNEQQGPSLNPLSAASAHLKGNCLHPLPHAQSISRAKHFKISEEPTQLACNDVRKAAQCHQLAGICGSVSLCVCVRVRACFASAAPLCKPNCYTMGLQISICHLDLLSGSLVTNKVVLVGISGPKKNI